MTNESKWIWKKDFSGKDLYCDFVDSFICTGGEVNVKISADSNYALYINGELVESGQYGDYPHYKIYDEFDITKYCKKGRNIVAISVWYYGKTTLCYYPGTPALRYEIAGKDSILTCSGFTTLCRASREYEIGLCKQITSQMGFGFHYDITKNDGWREWEEECEGFEQSAIVDQSPPLYPRPVKKLIFGEKRQTKAVKAENGTHFLFDIGEEEVGYLTFKLHSPVKQRLLIAYGEHIMDGGVRRLVGDRDFSLDVTVGEGENAYMNPFRRLGLRYLEVFAESPIEIEYMTVTPIYYPLEKVGNLPAEPLDKRIYEVCVRTLELCMHEHYEDCPWREQSLYCMDSRNQMLCGYYCFGEEVFPRANLKLMSMDNRADGVLSICFPSKDYATKNGLAIPSFSLHYYTQMREYITATGDVSLAKEAYPKLCSVIGTFTDRIKNGCVPSFEGAEYWNFYEWADGLVGTLGTAQGEAYEAALNMLLVIALRNMAEISAAVGEADDFSKFIPELKNGIRKRFFNAQTGFFYNREDDGKVSELVNALAILSDVCETEAEEKRIAEALTDPESGLTEITLSMLCFKYDALLKVDGKKYKDYILNNIRTKYKMMLDYGSTTVWETEDILTHAAGSLCHGWSALPVYYYEIFNGAKPLSALIP